MAAARGLAARGELTQRVLFSSVSTPRFTLIVPFLRAIHMIGKRSTRPESGWITTNSEVLNRENSTQRLFALTKIAEAQPQEPGERVAVWLGQMSGLSAVEIDLVLDAVARWPSVLDTAMLARLRTIFRDLPSAPATLAELATRLAPSVPRTPDRSWTQDDWLRWATQEYLPYFAWTLRTGQPRVVQQALATTFSDWLAEVYPGWLNSDNSPLVTNQFRTLRAMLEQQQQAVVVWAVIDGLAWWQGGLLQEACEARSLYVQELTTGVAMLPSLTAVSKRSLVTGLPDIEQNVQNIAQAARDQLGRSGISHHVTYSFDAALQHLKQQPTTRCLVVLFNLLDVLAHETTTFTDDAGIRGQLNGIAAHLAVMVKAGTEQGRIVHVLIGSDHGATLLPPDAEAISLPQSVKEVTDVWDPEAGQVAQQAASRAATVGDLDRLPPGSAGHWYILERQRYQLGQNYLVPRGYSYVGRRPTGWTHGGLTPEEVIVPVLPTYNIRREGDTPFGLFVKQCT